MVMAMVTTMMTVGVTKLTSVTGMAIMVMVTWIVTNGMAMAVEIWRWRGFRKGG